MHVLKSPIVYVKRSMTSIKHCKVSQVLTGVHKIRVKLMIHMRKITAEGKNIF